MSKRRISVRDIAGRARIPYANMHEANDIPPYAGADADWQGTLLKALPLHVTARYPNKFRCPDWLLPDHARDESTIDLQWHPLRLSDGIIEEIWVRTWTGANAHLEAQKWEGVSFEEWRYLNFESLTVSEWMAGFRGVVSHLPEKWHLSKPRTRLSGYCCQIIDRRAVLIGITHPRNFNCEMRLVTREDTNWRSRTEAEVAVSLVLLYNARNRPTHARVELASATTPVVRYLVHRRDVADRLATSAPQSASVQFNPQ